MPSFAVLVATTLLLLVAFTLPHEAAAQSSGPYGVNCESKKGQYKQCRMPQAERGVRLVEQRSKAPCTRGYSWGYTRDAVWVDKGCHGLFEPKDLEAAEGKRLTCSSKSGRFERCPAETRNGITLVRQISDSLCRKGRTWGYTRDYVWVDDGCRAEFRTGGGYSPAPPPDGSGAGSAADRITCQSRGESTRECSLDGSPRQVDLIRDLGEKRCKLGQNWGWNPRSIWVANRCGGVFEVEYR